jgi:hypothetical protein
MKPLGSIPTTPLVVFLILVLLLQPWQVAAAPISLVPGTVNMFRDTRAANDVIGSGDLFQFGAEIVGGSLGTTLGAFYPPTGFTVSQAPCVPLAVSPNVCTRTTAFNSSRLGQWVLRFANGPDALLVVGPPLAGAENPVPFPRDVTISGSGITPTLSWTVPGGFQPDGFRVNIFDKDDITFGGFANVIHSVAIPPTSTSYTLPAVLNSGRSLDPAGHYAIELSLIETRGHVPFTNNNAEILRRSRSFFDFTPLPPSAPPNVVLPTIVNGVYNFSVTQVGPDFVTFIDPPVAIGYDYAIGPGDPNFKSVVLPEAGDNLYDLYAWDGTAYVFHSTVTANVEVDLTAIDANGVDRFRILGIEPSAGLDPANPTAFITGLTFVTTGQFTGTMTPLVAETVAIDLKPGSDPNCINPRSKGVVAVAILGGAVDVTAIDRGTLQIDHDSNPATAGVAPIKSSFKDVDGDGTVDLVLHFDTQQLSASGVLADGRTLYVTGAFTNGDLFIGSDSVFLAGGPTCR